MKEWENLQVFPLTEANAKAECKTVSNLSRQVRNH